MKNILFIMTDQHRADHVSWHSDSKVAMPNLARIAEGTAFRNCISSNPICTPARSALLTGKYSHQIGLLQMSGDLSLQHPTYAQALQKAGYYTGGIGKFHWLQTWQWGRAIGCGINLVDLADKLKQYGFDEVWEASGKQLASRNYCDWCAHLESRGILDAYREHVTSQGKNNNNAEESVQVATAWPFEEQDYADIVTCDRALKFLDERPEDQPFMLFASFCSPHQPFDPPQRYLDQVPYEEVDDFVAGENGPMTDASKQKVYRLRQAYKAMLLLVDDQIGRLFAKLEEQGILDETVIIFTADHGEMLGDRGYMQKSKPWRHSATVPTAIRHPDHLSATQCESVVEMTDLTATILDVAGLDPQAALSLDWPAFNDIVPCRSLMPIIRGEVKQIREYAFSECGGQWNMIQSDEWKYIRSPGDDPDDLDEQLYHLPDDPDAQINLAGDPRYLQALDWCRRRLLHVLEKTPAAQTRWAPLMPEPDIDMEAECD